MANGENGLHGQFVQLIVPQQEQENATTQNQRMVEKNVVSLDMKISKKSKVIDLPKKAEH